MDTSLLVKVLSSPVFNSPLDCNSPKCSMCGNQKPSYATFADLRLVAPIPTRICRDCTASAAALYGYFVPPGGDETKETHDGQKSDKDKR